MTMEFTLPDVGEGVAEGELVSWLVEPGDTVSEDQPVAEVETDKALVEVPSPTNGTVRELHWAEGDVVPVGDLFITYNVEGEDDQDVTEQGADTASAEQGGADAADDADATPSTESEAGGEADESGETDTPSGRVFAPPSVRRLARELGVDIETVEGTGPSGRLTEGDVRAAAESDESAPAGTGDEQPTETGADASTAPESTQSAATRGGATAQVESADRERTLAAPATRKLAEEEGVDLNTVPTDEERDGEAFVTPEAVTEYAQAQRQAQEADAAAVATGETGPRERREPFKGVRKTIADAMVESKFSAPHVTHHDEVDVTKLVETRERLKPIAEEQGIRLTFMPFIMKAVVAALEEYPEMNAVIDEDNEEVVYRNYHNIGVAAATDVGLMVPVVDDADHKGMLQLSSEMNELVQKARERTISPDELQGSTFTITNIGGIGGEYATPILNYPESGILAVGEIKRKPRVVTDENGEESIEPRSVMTLSLSFDHRLIDGAVGAQFTNEVMKYLEEPERLLLE
ncbi:pyruvate/2-oxoglutarate dehydrogenase complex, dihydrolipoamide acyltransferase component [Halovivax ruber XH-70]|uniref:Pyruvate/2-oxoglutarate dehydrogenase complex, dihydrolipoamide acyltransferase component n=1 Tax=Halovivax ruber (strain DSM 18193 / JCM 13892 / XH-70) TaxID=797302 RepID=L0I9C5_HALRX|nr:2-oxo acid dehydrogenase subunit E2 [Halovivax ruber]AGB14821.1 pyruvate/2-oxoglutarate dehydrogenase complex, dihydrolipoamide acyltransferase component [Halovivax ruber XH-70]